MNKIAVQMSLESNKREQELPANILINNEIEEEIKEEVSEDEDNFFSKLHRVVNNNNIGL